jgi:cobalt-zinc-cadmium efflux system protein
MGNEGSLMSADRDRGHHHTDGHAGHAHGPIAGADRRWLTVALLVIVAFMGVEVIAGVIASSLALISDAAHMLTDAASLALALIAMRMAARPARGSYTYGLKRAEILSALLNGASLLLLAAWLAYEAIGRLLRPEAVTGWVVLAIGAAGLVVNIVAAWAMSKANRTSLNIQGAYQHILNDMFASIAALIAGAIIMLTGFARADSIATLVVVGLMIKAGWALLRDSGRILLEAAPAGVDPDAVADQLLSLPTVVEVHDLHVWVITSEQPALSAHVLVDPGADCHTVRQDLERMLADTYRITHTTLQVDHVGEDLLEIDSTVTRRGHCAEPHGVAHRGASHAH